MSIPQLVSQNFFKIQIGLFLFALFTLWRITEGLNKKSQFRLREADRKDKIPKSGPELAKATIPRPTPEAPRAPPLLLPGVRLVGEPHEILGVSENASESEILKAYKDAIKRFHPDLIQGQAKEQIKFYEETSAKLNEAKETLIRRIRSERS